MQARQLATREPRRPKQASLRRAISAAYYALFHLLIDEATTRFIMGRGRLRLRQCLGRAFAHRNMKEASRGFANNNVSQKIAPAITNQSVQPALANVAAAFIDLQQARHEADYDIARKFTRQEVLDLVELAEQVFEEWATVRKSLQADTYLVALLALQQMQA